MRPEVQRQQPHHFIRRWPRARRDKRGPSEYTEMITVFIDRVKLRMTGSPLRVVADELAKKEVLLRQRKGFEVAAQSALSVIHDPYTANILAKAKVTYKRRD